VPYHRERRPSKPVRVRNFIRGDYNGDGRVDASDAVNLLAVLFQRGEAGTCAAAGDTNSDARVDVSDAVFTLSYLFRSGPSPAMPHPTCGPGLPGDLQCNGSPACR
jgi:hypothetical protein